jgi:beta-lactamase superfamily II metal-dependent hydrolase
MSLPTTQQLEGYALSVVVFGPGFGESIVLRAATDTEPVWAVIDSARRERRRKTVNPALDLLVDQRARPSLVLLTHPHQDHTSGMAAIIERAAPGAILACVEPLLHPPSPYAPVEDPDDAAAVSRSQAGLAHRAMHSAWNGGSSKWSLLQGTSRELADWMLTVLHPTADEVDEAIARYGNRQRVNLNDLSASLLVEHKDIALVLGADCEHAAWTAIRNRMQPDDLLHTRPIKVPHHGSRKAIHPVLIDHSQRDVDRLQIVTPFPSSGRLPRFEADQGIEMLIAAAGSVDLTAMPVDLVASETTVTLAAARGAMPVEEFEGDPALCIRLDRPGGTTDLQPAVRDPYETWTMIGIQLDGQVVTSRGEHAVQIVA